MPRPSIVRARLGVIGQRLYLLSVSGKDADASGATATRFLDSFKFQP